jgi:carbon dioxide concentrating mechanism protein CcmO
MNATVGLLETTGLTPAMVAIDSMVKSAAVTILQVELNDLYGVCVKIGGATSAVQAAIETGHAVAAQMCSSPVSTVLTRVADSAVPALNAKMEYSPLIQQNVVFMADADTTSGGAAALAAESKGHSMKSETPLALGFIETQGFTAVFEAIDTACKAANVEVLAKEKLGGGYVTVVIQGDLSAVSSAIATGKEKVGGLGTLIAAHVIARPSESVLKLLQKL